MLDQRYTYGSFVALCNLLRQNREERLLPQIAEFLADTHNAQACLMYLIDASGRYLSLSAGQVIGHTNWAPTPHTIKIDTSARPNCPLVQLALTKVCFEVETAKTIYNIDDIRGVFQGVLPTSFMTFCPMLRRDGSLLGVVALMHDAKGLSQQLDTMMRLSVEASAHIISDQLSADQQTNQSKALARSLGSSELERRALKTAFVDHIQKRIPGQSDAVRRFRDRVRLNSRSDAPTLLTGKLNTSPSYFAKIIHDVSYVSNGVFLQVAGHQIGDDAFVPELFGHKRGAISGVAGARKGLLREAAGGTLLISGAETLGENSKRVLVDLLDRRVFRPLGSSRDETLRTQLIVHVDTETQQGEELIKTLRTRFGERILACPDLSQTPEDIEDVLQQLVQSHAADQGKNINVAADTLPKLMAWTDLHSRAELTAAVRTALNGLACGQNLTAEALQPNTHTDVAHTGPLQSIGLSEAIMSLERDLLTAALSLHAGNRTNAAHYLKIPKRTLADKCRKYGL